MSKGPPPGKKPGCGFLNLVLCSRKFWPRRATSTGSIRDQNRNVKKNVVGCNNKETPPATERQHRGRKQSINVTAVRKNAVKQIQGQEVKKTVPTDTMGISGELEMMINERLSNRKGGANLVRVTSGNVMVYHSLGNLRQSTKPVSNNRQEYHVPQQNGGKTIGGSISLCRALSCRMDPEELKIMGNKDYKNGRFSEALALYERAIDLDPTQASYRSNKSAALSALGRLFDAVFECREAINIDPRYLRAHHRLGNLYLRLGEGEKAVYHFGQAGVEADPDATRKAKAVLNHLKKRDDAKRLKDWHTVLRESDEAIAAGADSAPMVIALQAEAYLKLHRHEDADLTLANGPNLDVDQCTKFYGPARNATLLVIRAQIDIAAGRFDDAIEAVQHASRLDPSNKELGVVTRRARAVTAARSHGNDLFKAGKFAEACVVYCHGLDHEPYNAALLCNRAACRIKLGQFGKAVEDCSAALNVRPSYSKARLRRADCYAKLRKWEAAVRDYEILLQESPGDEDIGKALIEAQLNVTKKRGEDVGVETERSKYLS